jgi:hypothetical protein
MNLARRKKSRGFLSFLLSAVFMFALVSSAALLISQKPDYSYEQLQAAHIGQIAIKQAFYSSVSDAAASSFAVSQGTDADPRNAVRFAIWHRVQDVQNQLSSSGFDALFFCGEADDTAMQDAASEMQAHGAAMLPSGATPISSISCVHSLDVDLLKRKIHFFDVGFCAYSKQLGVGYCDIFPSSYEVDF